MGSPPPSFLSVSEGNCTDAYLRIVNVSIAVLGFIDTTSYMSIPYIEPGISLAVEHLEKKYNRIHFNLDLVYDSDYPTCEDSRDRVVRMASEWYYRRRKEQDVTVFIESACVDNTDLPYFQTQWDTLWISTVSASSKIRDRQLHPTWICTDNFFMTGCSEFYVDILNKYNWTSISVIIASSNAFYASMAARLINDFATKKSIVYTVHRLTLAQEISYGDLRPILEEIRHTSRVVLFFGDGSLLRQLMVTAVALNMTDGEYVYFAVEHYMFPPLHWQNNDGDDAAAFQAFQSLLIIHPSNYAQGGSTNKVLEDEFLARSRRDFNFTYQPTDQIYLPICENYQTIIALGKVLNESLYEEADSYRSGTSLAQKFLNRTFSNATCGESVYIDGEGQRRTDFMLSHFTASGSREPFLEKLGTNGEIVEILRLITWVSATFPPANKPACGYLHQDCRIAGYDRTIYAIVMPFLGLFLLLGAVSLEYIRRRYTAKDLHENGNWWQINLEQSPAAQPSLSVQRVAAHLDPKTAVGEPVSNDKVVLEMYNHIPVICTQLAIRSQSVTFADLSANRQLLSLLRKLHSIEHVNICRFNGLAITETRRVLSVCAVTECPPRGALPDIFDSCFTADSALASSLIRDYLDAVTYIHTSLLHYHGRITPLACRIDKHFTLKVIYVAPNRLENELRTACKDLKISSQYPSWESLYWSAPKESDENDAKAWQTVDIFSSAMIVYDLLTAGSLYRKLASMNGTVVRNRDLFLQELDFSNLTSTKTVLTSCRNVDPHKRPDIHQLRTDLAQAVPGLFAGRQRTLFETVHKRLVQYSADLEDQVAVRTLELKDEMHKCDVIINQFLPRTIVKQLRQGGRVLPEFFDCVTVMFTDLVGFSEFLKCSIPHDIISLIDETEACIDRLSTACDVYKVEAVGDSFMVASGVPDRNEEEHVKRIASFALRLRNSESKLEFLGGLRFKIGFHSGPCAAGLMGLKRPRYCLFGDTINMASRMCSHGMPGSIHLSPDSQHILEQFREFLSEPRGLVKIKGKSEMTTYWLLELRPMLD